MAAGWEFIVARSSDRKPIGKLRRCHDRTLSVDLNKSGQAGGWVPTDDPLTRLIVPWATCLVVQYTTESHEQFTFWSGPFNNRRTSLAQGRATFSAVGWFERLMHLNLQDQQLQFSNQDAGVIVAALLAKARLLDPRLQITMGVNELTRLRSVTYNLDQNIGQAILDLCNLESGFDWYIDPISVTLNIVAKRGDDRPNTRWMFIGDGKSEHSNLSEVEENMDGSTLVNDVRARGQYGTGGAVDFESQAQYGVFMEAPSLSDVVDTNILIAYANGEIVYRSQPRVTYTMTPKPGTDTKVPKLFRDFDIGDTTYLTARRDYIDVVDQATRIFGASLAISDTGVETLTNLQTTAG